LRLADRKADALKIHRRWGWSHQVTLAKLVSGLRCKRHIRNAYVAGFTPV
jgi:hypothetical protein